MIVVTLDSRPLAGGTNDNLLSLGHCAHEGPPLLDQSADCGLALMSWQAAPGRFDLGRKEGGKGRPLPACGKTGVCYAASSSASAFGSAGAFLSAFGSN